MFNDFALKLILELIIELVFIWTIDIGHWAILFIFYGYKLIILCYFVNFLLVKKEKKLEYYMLVIRLFRFNK